MSYLYPDPKVYLKTQIISNHTWEMHYVNARSWELSK